jgi:hypothetical protein
MVLESFTANSNGCVEKQSPKGIQVLYVYCKELGKAA